MSQLQIVVIGGRHIVMETRDGIADPRVLADFPNGAKARRWFDHYKSRTVVSPLRSGSGLATGPVSSSEPLARSLDSGE